MYIHREVLCFSKEKRPVELITLSSYKNKLDSRFYAIKRIRINPNSKQYNRQIIREIKLLSRLNHENVVRFVL